MNLPGSRNTFLPHSIGIGRSSMEGCGAYCSNLRVQ